MRLRSLLLLVAICGCPRGEEDEEELHVPHRLDADGGIVLTDAERQAIELETAVVERGVVARAELRFGKVVAHPDDDAPIAAPVVGRILASPVSLGASVHAGEAIVYLSPLVDVGSRASIEVQRRDIEGQIKGGRSRVQALSRELERVSTLVTSKLATEAERAHAQAELESEQAKLESLARAAGDLAQASGGRLPLSAPFDGTVAELRTGGSVEQGAIVARVVKAGPRWIDLSVPPDDASGSAYRVGTASAKLIGRGSVVAENGARIDRLEVDDPALLPGATVAVEVLHDSEGLVVPERALVRRGKQQLAFVETSPGRFEPRPLIAGARGGGKVIATEGLAAGDRVVVRGAAELLGELEL